jgi:hypothetical protein
VLLGHEDEHPLSSLFGAYADSRVDGIIGHEQI